MVSAGDFRNGVTLEMDGNIYQIIEFQHVKPGKGAAFVRTKLKNIINGGVVEGFKGDTATGATKPATVETGAVVYVPLFVETGDKLKIDTRTGEYLSRV